MNDYDKSIHERHEDRVMFSLRVNHLTDHELQRDLAKHEYVYGRYGLAIGSSCIVGGVVLFLCGVAGSTSWAAKFVGIESTITDAAPGAILFLVGIFIVLVTRPKFEHF